MNSAVRGLKWTTGILEAVLGIPFIGGFIIMSLDWTPLPFMFILHIIAVVLAKRERLPAGGNILGIITSFVAWIPFIGMLLHIVSAIVILNDAYQYEKQNKFHVQY
ncbi:MAG: hypothetical protein ACE3JP_08575 [Ectobacillus sp.]